MGYSTSLYLVDLAKLSAMVGSQDAAAKIRICALATANEGDRTPTDLKIYVTLDGELIVNGALLPLDAFEAELANPKNEGRAVCYFKRDSKNAEEGKRRGAGRFPSELGFVKYLDDANETNRCSLFMPIELLY